MHTHPRSSHSLCFHFFFNISPLWSSSIVILFPYQVSFWRELFPRLRPSLRNQPGRHPLVTPPQLLSPSLLTPRPSFHRFRWNIFRHTLDTPYWHLFLIHPILPSSSHIITISCLCLRYLSATSTARTIWCLLTWAVATLCSQQRCRARRSHSPYTHKQTPHRPITIWTYIHW